MKKLFLTLMLVNLVNLSCSDNNDEMDEINEKEEIITEYEISIESSDDIILLKKNNNGIIENSNYELVKNYIQESENITIMDIGNHKYRLYRETNNANKYLEKLTQSSIRRSSMIFGEAQLYENINCSGLNTTIRVSYGEPKVTWQIHNLNYIKGLYNTDGTTAGTSINLDNKISSLRLKNYVNVILYSEKGFKIWDYSNGFPKKVGITWSYVNNPDINGNPYERTVNLHDNPFSDFAPNNAASSVMVTCDVN